MKNRGNEQRWLMYFCLLKRLASEIISIHVAVISIENFVWQTVVLATDLYKSKRIPTNKAIFQEDRFCPKLFTFIFKTSKSSQTNPLPHHLQWLSLLQKKVVPYFRNISLMLPAGCGAPSSWVWTDALLVRWGTSW